MYATIEKNSYYNYKYRNEHHECLFVTGLAHSFTIFFSSSFEHKTIPKSSP